MLASKITLQMIKVNGKITEKGNILFTDLGNEKLMLNC